MDYVFTGKAARPSLCMQSLGLTMSLPGTVVFPSALAPWRCLLQGQASTVLLSGERPFPNHGGTPALKTDSSPLLSGSFEAGAALCCRELPLFAELPNPKLQNCPSACSCRRAKRDRRSTLALPRFHLQAGSCAVCEESTGLRTLGRLRVLAPSLSVAEFRGNYTFSRQHVNV